MFTNLINEDNKRKYHFYNLKIILTNFFREIYFLNFKIIFVRIEAIINKYLFTLDF